MEQSSDKNYLNTLVKKNTKEFKLLKNKSKAQNNVKSAYNYLYKPETYINDTANLECYFLRKSKSFNKGRYSRNRQVYRTGVYMCFYVNVVALYLLWFYFYKFKFKFTYLW